MLLLLISGFAVSYFQEESLMSIEKGQSSNYSESFYYHEIALIDKSNAQTDKVYAIKSDKLERGDIIADSALPFTLEIGEYHAHALFGRADKNPQAQRIAADRGLGARGDLTCWTRSELCRKSPQLAHRQRDPLMAAKN